MRDSVSYALNKIPHLLDEGKKHDNKVGYKPGFILLRQRSCGTQMRSEYSSNNGGR